MSRPRSHDKSIPISVAIPLSLVTRLNEELSYRQSRSKYICRAIQNRLDEVEENAISTRSTRQLMAALSHREDIDDTLKILLLQLITNQN
jgi:metal-responsive CopG/Arc/MetJ family transcriptional regulator